MTTLDELKAELEAAKAVLAQDQTVVTDTRAEIAVDEATLANALVAVASDEAHIADVQAAIDAYQTPSGEVTLQWWCQSGGDWKSFSKLTTDVKTDADLGFRSTGGEGQMDNDFIIAGTKNALAAGYTVSLQVQPKTGSGGSRKGSMTMYKDIAAGKYDVHILAGFKQIAQYIPAGMKVPLEPHSEFNIQHGPIDPQPDAGPAADYAPFVMKLHDLAKQAGARDKLLFVPSAAGPNWWSSNEKDKWLTKALWDSGVIDGLWIDFYAKVQNGLNAPDPSTKAIREYARKHGVPWGVGETGCNEVPGHPFDKSNWYGLWPVLMDKEGHDCNYVTFNTTLAPYSVYSSSASFAAFSRLCKTAVWKGVVA